MSESTKGWLENVGLSVASSIVAAILLAIAGLAVGIPQSITKLQARVKDAKQQAENAKAQADTLEGQLEEIRKQRQEFRETVIKTLSRIETKQKQQKQILKRLRTGNED